MLYQLSYGTKNQSQQADLQSLKHLYNTSKTVTIVSAKDGRIGYKAEGSTETAYISRETLNAWKAAEEVTNNATNLINSAKDQYNNEIKNLSIECENMNDSLILSWTIPFTESKSLHVSVSIPYELTAKDKHYYRVLTWQTMPND